MQHLSEVIQALGQLDRAVTAIRGRVERGGSIGELETKLRTVNEQVVSFSARLDAVEARLASQEDEAPPKPTKSTTRR